MAADALVQIQDHADLCTNFHFLSSSSGIRSRPRSFRAQSRGGARRGPGGAAGCLNLGVSVTRRLRVGVDFLIHPVDLRHLAHDDEFVAVGADRAVVVEAVALLRVAADHVRGLEHRARHGVVNAAAGAG